MLCISQKNSFNLFLYTDLSLIFFWIITRLNVIESIRSLEFQYVTFQLSINFSHFPKIPYLISQPPYLSYIFLPNRALMVVGFTMCNQRRGVLDSTLCDKVCKWLATGRWLSLGPPVSYNNKTDRHDITVILLKVKHILT